MEKYKVDYRVFTHEPLLASSADYVFTVVKFINEPMKFAVELADFAPDTAEDIVRDFVERNPQFAGKTFWVQQNAYRLEGPQIGRYNRITFVAFRIDPFPAE